MLALANPIVLASVPGAAAAGDSGIVLTDLPPWQTFAMVDELTPEMHWYRVDYDSVERCSCQVGIPLDDTFEPRLRCWYPGVHTEDRQPIPDQARAGARKAVQAVRRSTRGDERRASRIDVHYEGTWRKLLLRDVVLRVPGPPDKAIFTSTRAAFRIDPDGGLVLLEHGPLGEAEGGTGLHCYGSPCTSNGLLPWVPPPPLDGSSLLWGLVWDLDPQAQAAWPALEHQALLAVAAMDAGTWSPAPPSPRPAPGAASTVATWALTIGQQREVLPIDLALAAQGPFNLYRRVEGTDKRFVARFDVGAGHIELVAWDPAGTVETATWPLPTLAIAPHGGLTQSAVLDVPYGDLTLKLGELEIHGDNYIHPGPLATSPDLVRLPTAGQRDGDRVVWTAWEWLDPGPSRILGLRLEVCIPGDPDACSGLLQGGAQVPADFDFQLPQGHVDVNLEVFDTDVPTGHLWQPGSGDYHKLWSSSFTASEAESPPGMTTEP